MEPWKNSLASFVREQISSCGKVVAVHINHIKTYYDFVYFGVSVDHTPC